jgi:putative ABC transport system substrate-binding protein
MSIRLRRREVIAALGGAAAGWPVAVRAQQARRIGVLTAAYSQTDREGQARVAAFINTFQRLGWTDGRNFRIEYRWSADDAKRIDSFAQELVHWGPDVIVVQGNPALSKLHS